jgi:tRNA A-37 threonylcarbamoyl transferase component Bud32/tetratricopeptide (TPR) repeat protein
MTPEKWQQVYQLFNSALERDAEERDAFLDAACRDNPSLRVAVENLIVADERAGGFLREPLLVGLAASSVGEATEVSMVGRRFGAYRIVRELGRGGMGAVYLAERADEQFEKQVAIKIVRHGMDSEELRRRFRRERQILAGLDHPNIARLLDGGVSEDGLPYFVMEYVEGVAINEYCRRGGLNTTARLELFLRVRDAVQHAHRNRVVHRDLKPGNILVGADGAPKLLDFGIARFLQPGVDQTVATADGMRPMTPAYASPEQARGGEIAETSDVYSLGVTLYELLTGKLPYRLTSASAEELARAIREQEPERPSAAPENPHGRLAGELDDVVLMALRKEPERRYASVEQLAEDIRRHLAGHPVIARGESLGYRARKFIRRHRAGVAAAAFILLSLLGVIGATREAGIAQARAEMSSNDLRKLALATISEFHDAIKKLAGSTEAQALLIRQGLEYLDKLARESGDDQLLQRQLAEAYDKFGDVQSNNARYGDLSDPAAALESYRKALAIRQALARAKDDWQGRYDLMVSHRKIGDALDAGYRTAEALASYRTALALAEQLLAIAPENERLSQELVYLHRNVSLLLRRSGESAEALNHDHRAWAILASLRAKGQVKELENHDLSGSSRANLGAQLREAGDLAGALAYYQRMLALAETTKTATAPERSDSCDGRWRWTKRWPRGIRIICPCKVVWRVISRASPISWSRMAP